MLLATPFLTADAAEMTSMEVGVKDVSVAGPPSKCEGSPHSHFKFRGHDCTPNAQAK